MRDSLWARVGGLAIVASACGGEPPSVESAEQTFDPLMQWTSLGTSAKGYPNGNVMYFYTWDQSPLSVSPYITTIYHELFKNWSSASNATFFYGGTSGYEGGKIAVSIEDRSASLTEYGNSTTWSHALIHFARARVGNGYTVSHEFGHAIGYQHAEYQPGYSNGHCTSRPPESGNAFFTAADPDSIMEGCTNNTPLSFWDELGAQQNFGERVPALSMISGWSKGTTDAATIASTRFARLQGEGYSPVYSEGYVWDALVPGTRELRLYYSAAHQDYFTVARPTGAHSRETAAQLGYTDLGRVGAIYTTVQPGTVALKLYYRSNLGGQYFTTSNATARAAALAAGYVEVGTEGYLFPQRPYSLLYWFARLSGPGTAIERTTTALDGALSDTLLAGGSGWVPATAASPSGRFFGAVLKHHVTDTIPLKVFFNASRREYYTCAQSCRSSTPPAGYGTGQTVGYVFDTYAVGAKLTRYFNASLLDNYTTSATAPTGYASPVTEGYALAVNSGS